MGDGRRAGSGKLEVVESNPQGLAAFEIIEKGVVGLLRFCGVFLGKVHQIRAMWQDMTKMRVKWEAGTRG